MAEAPKENNQCSLSEHPIDCGMERIKELVGWNTKATETKGASAKKGAETNPDGANRLKIDQTKQMGDLQKKLESMTELEKQKIINETEQSLQILRTSLVTYFSNGSEGLGTDTDTYMRAEAHITGTPDDVNFMNEGDLKMAVDNLGSLITKAKEFKKPEQTAPAAEPAEKPAETVAPPATTPEKSGDPKKMEKSEKFIKANKRNTEELDHFVQENPTNAELKKIQDLIKNPTETNIVELQEKVYGKTQKDDPKEIDGIFGKKTLKKVIDFVEKQLAGKQPISATKPIEPTK
ncbi:MAG: hypothetical protein PHH16_01310 [Candidatus Gracilibacteria bacterium]|nr:hypothetical protein [Candidatus Gracilibacteria bacterium]